MKILKKVVPILLVIIPISSCVEETKFWDSFLQKPPGVDVTLETIFSEAEYARRFLWDTYSGLYYGFPSYWGPVDNKMGMGMFEMLSDTHHSHLSWDGVNALYYSGAYNAGSEDTYTSSRFGYTKEECWETIRKGWIFIANIDRVPDMLSTEKLQLKAEAKFIIASRYFDLYRHLGGLPIIDHAWDVNEPSDVARGTIAQTHRFMMDILDEAIPFLPWRVSQDEFTNWDGRVTQAAAMGLKCKIALFTASPLFNDHEPYCTESPQDAVVAGHVWLGSYNSEYWDECLQVCEEFFVANSKDGNSYHLCENAGDYRAAFRKGYSSRGSGYDNPEMVFSTRVKYTWTSLYEWNYYFIEAHGYGAFTPTFEYMEMFPMADGAPFDFDNPKHKEQIFTNRDPRMFESILVNGAHYAGSPAQMWVGGREMKNSVSTESGEYATGLGQFKFIMDKVVSKNKPTLWPYIRLSDIHLIYAEALMMTGDINGAISRVDLIRDRVGLKGLRESNNGKIFDKKSLLEEILRERACELGFEDVRLFDLIRHKLANKFTKPLHGLITRRADGVEKPLGKNEAFPRKYTYEKFELQKGRRIWWEEGGFSPKWYLTAFPPSEINKGYGLTQNPGW